MTATASNSVGTNKFRGARGKDNGAEAKETLHRISTVRQRQGVSLRSAARQMRVDIRQLRSQEEESSDLMLSTLYKWQKVLDVPISELLVDVGDPLSPAIMQRARLLKIMKTVTAILERSKSAPITRLAQMLFEQLVEVMPELKDVSPWHSVGQRRSADELGVIAERQLSEDLLLGR